MIRSVKWFFLAMFVTTLVFATNGDNMIGVGPTSRAMGGVGIADAQDSISAIFANPATLSQLDGDQFNFTGTYFNPTVKAKVVSPPYPYGVGVWSGKSQDAAFSIPAIGLSHKINENFTFGLGAYGVSGMGVDYRNIDPMNTNTKVSVMKFVTALAYKHGNFSYGIGLDLDYQGADFGQGLSHNYALGARIGANYQYERWKFGLVYVTPQNVNHERIFDFDGDHIYDKLKLENPAQYGFGVSYKFSDRVTSAVDVKYYDWNSADGYKDFNWDSQWVYAWGLSYKATDKLVLRVGYNYGKNPVNEDNNFNPAGMTVVQGKAMPTFGYEYFRIVGFPAVVEKHFTCGLGYDLSDKVGINLGYKHAYGKTIKETFAYGSIESKLSEDAVDFGVTVKF